MPEDFDVKEKRFEQDIEEYLITAGGYTKGDPSTFNREKGLDEETFVSFIKTSQPKLWEKYVKIYGDTAKKQIVDRFMKEVKQTNLLNVLRHGFTDRGIKFRAVFWKPETSLNETSKAQYGANILHCTRQLHYSLKNENSIDIVLFVNGIPVVSIELKCQFTGQNTANAINQYKFDRAGKSGKDEGTFLQYLIPLLNEKGIDNATAYKSSNIDRRTFSKIMCGDTKVPQKRTLLGLCIGLKLDLEESKKLLASADMAFNPMDDRDNLVIDCINNGQYDIFEVNMMMSICGFEYLGNVLDPELDKKGKKGQK